MQRILVATDGSPAADRAVDAAANIAKVTGAQLFILTVGGKIAGTELRQLASSDGDLSKKLESMVDEILSQARERALRAGVSTVEVRSAWGDTAEEILDAAAREKVDILVVGRRGQSRLSGLLLGSVTQKMAVLAPCIVMVVP